MKIIGLLLLASTSFAQQKVIPLEQAQNSVRQAYWCGRIDGRTLEGVNDDGSLRFYPGADLAWRKAQRAEHDCDVVMPLVIAAIGADETRKEKLAKRKP
jgi:hypothetical protein